MQLSLLAFGLNALIADGFMPAALGNGIPVQLCPDGLAFARPSVSVSKPHKQSMGHAAHHEMGDAVSTAHNEHDEHDEHDAFSASECPFGAAPVAFASLDIPIVPIDARTRVSGTSAPAASLRQHTTQRYLARAPPA